MTIQELKNLNVGDKVYYMANTGSCGIFEYQYIGVILNTFENKEYRVFLSEFFLSTRTIQCGTEERSRHLKTIFLTLKEAEEYQRLEREKEEY